MASSRRLAAHGEGDGHRGRNAAGDVPRWLVLVGRDRVDGAVSQRRTQGLDVLGGRPVVSQDGELVTQNNTREALINAVRVGGTAVVVDRLRRLIEQSRVDGEALLSPLRV